MTYWSEKKKNETLQLGDTEKLFAKLYEPDDDLYYLCSRLMCDMGKRRLIANGQMRGIIKGVCLVIAYAFQHSNLAARSANRRRNAP